MKLYFDTYGCTLNSGEAGLMMKYARDSGHDIAAEPGESDAVVLVTCTVIEQTENKMLKRLNELSAFNKPIAVAGCMAAVQSGIIEKKVPGTYLLPTPGQVEAFKSFLDQLSGSISDKNESLARAAAPDEDVINVSNNAFAEVPIAEGCMGECTYCITRLARGNLRSYKIEDVVHAVRDAVLSGAVEIRLTAQDSALFGMDEYGSSKLPDLLHKLIGIKGTGKNGGRFKIRVGMMNPNSLLPILDEMIETYKDEKLFKFIHLPVQSGSDRILELMGRRYDVSTFKNLIESYRSVFTDLTLSTDIITGFPGEEESDHRLSCELIKDVKPDIVNITRFSERPGTTAEKLPGKLHGRVIKARSRELTELYQGLSLRSNQTLMARKFNVIATERDISRYKNTTMARTDSYKPVVVEGILELGKQYLVEVTSANEAYLIGKTR